MYIQSVRVRNFRLLKETVLELNSDKKQNLSLLIGKNNSGKTSFIVLFDKFFQEGSKFDFNDFSLCLREKLRQVETGIDLSSCTIQLGIDIAYSKGDNLASLSEFILDLNPETNIVRLLFECEVEMEKLIVDLSSITEKNRIKFIEKNLGEYLKNRYYVYNKLEDLNELNRPNVVEKSIADVRRLINYQVIHAKRNVSSSEYNGNRRTALSELATDYFNKDNIFSKEAFGRINDEILDMDDSLNDTYAEHFKDYFSNVKQFVEGKLNVVSNLESKAIMSNYSRIIYGEVDAYLPETLNGLGHLNILFLLLQIEVKKKFFEQENRSINILFIEEPEAHTHPQMQYVFAQKIKGILETIPNNQTFITSHSSHIVSQCDFEDIRYFKLKKDNIEVMNFHKDLKAKYGEDEQQFKFLKQYLTLYSSELFFAEKIIFLEGVSEKLLLPYFIKNYDLSRKGEQDYVPLTSQNISFLEAGANAKVFRYFIDFLGIKTLIFTDLDGCEIKDGENGRKYWVACETIKSLNTTNVTIKHYYNAPELPTIEDRGVETVKLKLFDAWYSDLKQGKVTSISPVIQVSHQTLECDYHARSFEDAFLAINLKSIVEYQDQMHGLKNKDQITIDRKDFYDLTQKVLKQNGKSDFASSVLYLALTKDVEWKTPKYIIDGLNWISK